MTKKGREIPVDENENDENLKQKVKDILCQDVLIDKEKIVENLEGVDNSVCAILVQKKSDFGFVRFYDEPMVNVPTGPDQRGMVIVVRKDGEVCHIVGRPTVRYFRRSSPVTPDVPR